MRRYYVIILGMETNELKKIIMITSEWTCVLSLTTSTVDHFTALKIDFFFFRGKMVKRSKKGKKGEKGGNEGEKREEK